MINKLKALVTDELMAVNSAHMIERLIQYDFSLEEIKQFFPNMTIEALEKYRNPNAMAFAHWLDKQEQKQTAYTELKEWCEKHLSFDEYMASNSRIISINSTDFYFDTDGSLNFID